MYAIKMACVIFFGLCFLYQTHFT